MSYGIVICSVCHREVHQDGLCQSWTHCEDKSPRCEGANSIYPSSPADIKGEWCGKDAGPDGIPDNFKANKVRAVPDFSTYSPPPNYLGRVPRFGPMGPAPFLRIPGDPRRKMTLKAPVCRIIPEKRTHAHTPPKPRNQKKTR